MPARSPSHGGRLLRHVLRCDGFVLAATSASETATKVHVAISEANVDASKKPITMQNTEPAQEATYLLHPPITFDITNHSMEHHHSRKCHHSTSASTSTTHPPHIHWGTATDADVTTSTTAGTTQTDEWSLTSATGQSTPQLSRNLTPLPFRIG